MSLMSLQNLVSLKNAQISKKSFVVQKITKNIGKVLDLLWYEGLILGYVWINDSYNTNTVKIFLKYVNNKPVLNTLKIVSKSSKTFNLSVKHLSKLKLTGTVILTTNKGFLTFEECKKQKLGGKCFVIVK